MAKAITSTKPNTSKEASFMTNAITSTSAEKKPRCSYTPKLFKEIASAIRGGATSIDLIKKFNILSSYRTISNWSENYYKRLAFGHNLVTKLKLNDMEAGISKDVIKAYKASMSGDKPPHLNTSISEVSEETKAAMLAAVISDRAKEDDEFQNWITYAGKPDFDYLLDSHMENSERLKKCKDYLQKKGYPYVESAGHQFTAYAAILGSPIIVTDRDIILQVCRWDGHKVISPKELLGFKEEVHDKQFAKEYKFEHIVSTRTKGYRIFSIPDLKKEFASAHSLVNDQVQILINDVNIGKYRQYSVKSEDRIKFVFESDSKVSCWKYRFDNGSCIEESFTTGETLIWKEVVGIIK